MNDVLTSTFLLTFGITTIILNAVLGALLNGGAFTTNQIMAIGVGMIASLVGIAKR